MIKYKNNNKLILSVFLIILLLTSNDTVMFGTNISSTLLFVPRILSIVFIAIILAINFKKRTSDFLQFFILFILLSIIIISFYFNSGEIETLLSRIIVLITAFSIVNTFSLKEFANVFNSVLYILSIVSIILYSLVIVFPGILNVMPTIVNNNGLEFSYFVIGGFLKSTVGSGLIPRSSSIFWEPGAFSVYIIFALYFQLFVLKNNKVSVILIYTLALLLTFSTTGYIALTFLFISFILSDSVQTNKKSKRILLGILLMFLVFMILGTQTNIYNLVFSKVINRTSTSVTRYASIINGMQIGFDFPLLGVFPNNVGKYMEIYARKTTIFDFGANPMNTNTVTYQFAAFGLIFGFIFTLYNYKFFRRNSKGTLSFIMIFLTFLLAYSGELFYSFLPFVLVFYGVKKDEKMKNRSDLYV